MKIDEIERVVRKIRDKPLRVVCVLPTGTVRALTIRQCAESKARYVHIIADELDEFLGRELGGDNERP